MNLHPLLAASPVIQLHVAAAVGAVGLGTAQFLAPKGTIPHRLAGWLWVGLLGTVVLSSFFIHVMRMWGPWSPLHLLSIFTLVMLVRAVLAAHQHRVQSHRRGMIWMYGGAMLSPGVIAFWPGRTMYRVFFGS
jgi:uncharacterized membrane protein